MVRNIDQQILLQKALDSSLRRDGWDNLHGGWSDVDVGDEDASVEVARGQCLGEGAHLLNADVRVGQELDVDGADVWLWRVWVRGGGWRGVFLDHLLGWAGGLDHLLATGVVLELSC